MKLSKQEKELLESVENGEWESIPDFKDEQKRYQALAKNNLKKDQRINIRIATKDLMGLQKKAMLEGVKSALESADENRQKVGIESVLW